ncbi:MAG TPA: gamma-glutamyl-phosphate reductase, partial [Acidimicrobiia bacterium]|nr:gamma-glutamyl-phosphate reductase [Acidimicrobiia bacterium]
MNDTIGAAAREAARAVAAATTAAKNQALLTAADHLLDMADDLIVENASDLLQAEKEGVAGALLDRLRLTPDRVAGMAS